MCIPDLDPQSQKAKSYVFIIRILIVVQLIISILIITSASIFISHGIVGLFLAFILFVSQKLVNHNLLLFQILLSIYFTFIFLFACLTFLQNSTDLTTSTTKVQYDFAVFVISFVYYLAVSIFFYYPYKQFKKVFYKRNPALTALFQNNQSAKQMNLHKQRQYDPAYGDVPIDPRKKNNDRGIYEVPRGQGIKL